MSTGRDAAAWMTGGLRDDLRKFGEQLALAGVGSEEKVDISAGESLTLGQSFPLPLLAGPSWSKLATCRSRASWKFE